MRHPNLDGDPMSRNTGDDHDTTRILALLHSELPGLVAVYRYGSSGSAAETPESDVDVAVLPEAPLAAEALWRIRGALAEALGRDVDLVDLLRVTTVLKAEVLESGRLVYARDASKVDAFEVQVMSMLAQLNLERAEILEDIRARGTIHG
jgi:uncharacterized protein